MTAPRLSDLDFFTFAGIGSCTVRGDDDRRLSIYRNKNGYTMYLDRGCIVADRALLIHGDAMSAQALLIAFHNGDLK